jgi:hypothetical protein
MFGLDNIIAFSVVRGNRDLRHRMRDAHRTTANGTLLDSTAIHCKKDEDSAQR